MAFHDKTATQVTNIELNVRDLDLMTTFYKNILGLSVKVLTIIQPYYLLGLAIL